MDFFSELRGNSNTDAINAALLDVATSLTTLMAILVLKGIATQEEILDTKLRLTPIVEQEFQKKKDEAQKQWREDNPQQADAIDFFNKVFGIGK